MKCGQSGQGHFGQNENRIFNMQIENNKESFVQLWKRLERTRRLLGGQYKRFCIRNVLKAWFGTKATDDFIWEVCYKCEQEGWNPLPLPSLYPRPHREFLRAVVTTVLRIGRNKVKTRDFDDAYSEAFPHSTPLNVSKKIKNEK